MNKSDREVFVVVIGMMALGAILFFPQPPFPPAPPAPPDGNGWVGTNLAPLNEWHDPPPQWSPTFWEPTGFKGTAPALRNEGSGTLNREINSDWIAVKPGDRLVFLAWMKTNPSVLGQEPPNGENRGVRIGLDFYDGDSQPYVPNRTPYIAGVAWNCYGEEPHMPYTPTGQVWGPIQQDIWDNFVPWGSGWSLRVIDLLVPAKVWDHRDGCWCKPLGVILWFGTPWGVRGETATAWLAETEFYINPQTS